MANKHWRKNQGKDRFFQQAKEDGYRARSAYKLHGINEKFRVLRKGDRVLDIGAAPGSWSQSAREIIGPRGVVVAVDLQRIEPLEGVICIQGDIREQAIWQQIEAAAGDAPFNTVISDIAPSTTGIAVTDHARSIELSLFALAMGVRWLRPGGNFVTKVFAGEDLAELVALAKRFFRRVTLFDPEATRRESKETFLVAKALHARAPLDPELGMHALQQIETEEL